MKPKREVIVSVRLTLDESKVLEDLAKNDSTKDKSDILRLPIVRELNRRKRLNKGTIAS